MDLIKFRGELKAELYNIVEFWSEEAFANPHELFGEIDFYGNPKKNAPQSVLLYSHVIWALASVSVFLNNDSYLQKALRLQKKLNEVFFDSENGGYFWLIDHENKPVVETKFVRAQAAVMLAYTKLFELTQNDKMLTKAMAVFYSLETRCADFKNGGYIEAFSRNWDSTEDYRISSLVPNMPKSTITHIQTLHAMCELYKVSGNPHVKNAAKSLLELVVEKGIENNHIIPYCTMDWQRASEYYSFGHDIEALRVIATAAKILFDQEKTDKIIELSLKMSREFLSIAFENKGAVSYEYDFCAKEYDSNVHRWVQSEAMFGLLNAYNLSGDSAFLEATIDVWDYINKNMIDRKNGEWYSMVDCSGQAHFHTPKQGEWRTPYCNVNSILGALGLLVKI